MRADSATMEHTAPQTVTEVFPPSPSGSRARETDSADLPPLCSQPAGSHSFFASATSIVLSHNISQFWMVDKGENIQNGNLLQERFPLLLDRTRQKRQGLHHQAGLQQGCSQPAHQKRFPWHRQLFHYRAHLFLPPRHPGHQDCAVEQGYHRNLQHAGELQSD